MKRMLLSLWLTGAVVYAGSTLLFTNIALFGDDEPKPVARDIGSTSLPYPKVGTAKPIGIAPTQPEQVEAVNPALANAPHAISPEQAPSQSPTVEMVQLEEQTSAVVEVKQAPSGPGANEAQVLKLNSPASIRNGPSAAADIIGTARAGAEVQVASSDSGWVQIVDPSSGRTGWIASTVLSPLPATIDIASTETPPANQLTEDERLKPRAGKQKTNTTAQFSRAQKAQEALPTKSKRQAPREYVDLPPDEALMEGELLPPRNRGLFGILANRRMLREDAPPLPRSRR